jgi:hypothetical protein
VRQNFDELDQLSKKPKGSSEEMMLWIRRANRTLSMPPKEAFESIQYESKDGKLSREAEPFPPGRNSYPMNVIDVSDENQPSYWITFDMWTEEDGRSDFTLELAVTDVGSKDLEVDLEDLHVM